MTEVHDETWRPLKGIPESPNRLFVSFFGLARDFCTNCYGHVCVSSLVGD